MPGAGQGDAPYVQFGQVTHAGPAVSGVQTAQPGAQAGRVAEQGGGMAAGSGCSSCAGDSASHSHAHPPAASAPQEPPTFVYAIGRIEPRFPGLGIEKEFAQATGRAATAGLSDRQAAHAVLTDPANRYLVRQLCWVLTIEGLDTYVLRPRDGGDLDMLVEAVRPSAGRQDVDVVVGFLGPLAGPEVCNGLVAPQLAFDQVYSFDTASFLAAIPRPEELDEEQFRASAGDLFARIGQLADNTGATDEHRALNYLAVRYPAIYARAAQQFARDTALTNVEVRPSRLAGIRKIVNVVFTYTHRATAVPERFAVKVDVTEEFPFLVSDLAPYYDR
ncbi:hypothetical protein [Thermomonospora umbrina]|nr:hypothetical protein [Thermomonospora umbrina]